jgi:hypothetical protein
MRQSLLLLALIFMHAHTLSASELGEGELVIVDISGEYLPFILAGFQHFKEDQANSMVENFDVYLEDEDSSISVTFIPKLTPESIKKREERSSDNVIFMRHNPQNEYGRTITYHLSKDDKSLIRKVYP